MWRGTRGPEAAAPSAPPAATAAAAAAAAAPGPVGAAPAPSCAPEPAVTLIAACRRLPPPSLIWGSAALLPPLAAPIPEAQLLASLDGAAQLLPLVLLPPAKPPALEEGPSAEVATPRLAAAAGTAAAAAAGAGSTTPPGPQCLLLLALLPMQLLAKFLRGAGPVSPRPSPARMRGLSPGRNKQVAASAVQRWSAAP